MSSSSTGPELTDKSVFCPHPGCAYTAQSAAHLRVHSRKHTGIRPYACDHPGCTYSATQTGNLTQHKRTHTGERPFKCTIAGCDYAAVTSTHLTVHVQRHTVDFSGRGSDGVPKRGRPGKHAKATGARAAAEVEASEALRDLAAATEAAVQAAQAARDEVARAQTTELLGTELLPIADEEDYAFDVPEPLQ